MYIVTGGAGFIGSNLVEGLNKRGKDDILVVDELNDGSKIQNLSDCRITDYQDKDEFLRNIEQSGLPLKTTAVFHMGACSNTMEENVQYVMQTNFEYSKKLLHACTDNNTPLIYASSAATYGAGTIFQETEEYEYPLNAYAFSKLLFDRYVRKFESELNTQVVGLRYFNVYGPREHHKGSMSSMVYQMIRQFEQFGKLRLFSGTSGFNNGEQRRDFISVDDIVRVNLFFLDRPQLGGIFNAGTGASRSFNDAALAVINSYRSSIDKPPATLEDSVSEGLIEYFDMPAVLRKRYQSFTEADITRLSNVGFPTEFYSLETGVSAYLAWLTKQSSCGM